MVIALTNSNPLPEYSFPLFVPGNRPDRIAKAQASVTDTVIIDLEDAVAETDKAQARSDIKAVLKKHSKVSTFIRINGYQTDWYNDDVALCAGLPIDGIVLPKAESIETLQSLCSILPPNQKIIALIETAIGLANVRSIATACDRLAFGSIDYCVDLRIQHTRMALLHARSEIVMASRLANLCGPLDGVTMNVSDAAVIQDDAMHGSELGFAGKLLIHPAQIVAARRGFAPSKSEIIAAEQVIAASKNGGVVSLDGKMVDAPVVAKAREVLERREILK